MKFFFIKWWLQEKQEAEKQLRLNIPSTFCWKNERCSCHDKRKRCRSFRNEKVTDEITNPIKKEWDSIKGEAHGIKNTTIFTPVNTDISHKNINDNICEKITLDVNDIEPESLSGLIQQITDKGAQSLVSIF